MKKTANAKRHKLTLDIQTVRTLTSQDLNLVIGGACQHGSQKTITRAPWLRHAGGPHPDIPTCE
jgi:hypothetical protein